MSATLFQPPLPLLAAHHLEVFDADRRVGTVSHDPQADRFELSYDPAWSAAVDAYPLSPALPFAALQGGYAPNTVKRFLENLLPEGHALDAASSTYQVSKANVFALVRVLGRETPGALSFRPMGTSTEPAAEPAADTMREISRDELAERIAQQEQVPLQVWDGRIRISVPGLQEKVAVYIDGEGRLFLVEGRLSSTHLLKPQPTDARLPMLVANEHFCMHLAERIGLPAAAVSILRVPYPILAVQRFDRVRDADQVRRIHLVDGCQLCDVPVTLKYERAYGTGRDVAHIRDGVSFERLFARVGDAGIAKAADRQTLLRWALFQLFVGNSDAHAKNISFLMARDGIRVAPAYDLVSAVAYKHFDNTLAMAFGDAFDIDAVDAPALASFAFRCVLDRKVVAREIKRMAAQIGRHAPALVHDQAYLQEEREFVGLIAADILQRADRLAGLADEIPKVSAADL